MKKKEEKQIEKQLPINKEEDVEFSLELADTEDLEAIKRSQQADKRQEK